jgi:hypothetical protein
MLLGRLLEEANQPVSLMGFGYQVGALHSRGELRPVLECQP